VATTAVAYGSIWELVFREVVSAHHVVDDGPHVVSGGDAAASTLRFEARIGMLGGVTDIRATTLLVWRRTRDGWRIVRQHNSTEVLSPGERDGRFGAA